MEAIYAHIDSKANDYISKLSEAVAIPSVSGDAAHRPDVLKMGLWLSNELKSLGVDVKLHYPGKQVLDGKEIDLPPVILGKYGADPLKKTVLVYGHYDVQPALKSDGWKHDPFTLVEDDKGRMYGRGSTDDKGPILGWLWAIQLHQELKKEFPVNLVMCFEGMEESGSEGLDDLIYAEAKGFFKTVDFVCISDNCKFKIFFNHVILVHT
jgi:Cys-Gly metallodipeptidase DUG1